MFKYVSKYCLMGMMSNNYEILGNWQGFKKNKNKAVSFDTGFVPDFRDVFFSYIYDKPNFKSTKMKQVVSKFDNDFFALGGKKYREIRETRNKFDKIVEVKEYSKSDTLALIDKWDINDGGKYKWFRHSGYDRAFFNRWFDLERENLISRFYYIGAEMIGYSILHKNNDCYDYLIRKTDSTRRNTCLYVDYKTFEYLHQHDNSFFVNWGASNGTLLKYKQKFPIYQESDVFFFKKQ